MRIFSNTSRRNNIHSALLLSCALVVSGESASAAEIEINVPTGTATFNGNLVGVTDYTKIGTGIALLGGTNTYTGDTTVSAGTLELAAATAHSGVTGNFNIAAASTLKSDADMTTAKTITITGAIGTVDATGFALTLNGAVADGGFATVLKGTSVTFGAGNIWSGASLKIATTTLTIPAANNIASAVLLVNDGTTVVLTGGVTYAPTSLGIY